MDSRGSEGQEEFLVKWKGFPEANASWESAILPTAGIQYVLSDHKGHDEEAEQYKIK